MSKSDNCTCFETDDQDIPESKFIAQAGTHVVPRAFAGKLNNGYIHIKYSMPKPGPKPNL
jgi:hypothetical protein